MPETIEIRGRRITFGDDLTPDERAAIIDALLPKPSVAEEYRAGLDIETELMAADLRLYHWRYELEKLRHEKMDDLGKRYELKVSYLRKLAGAASEVRSLAEELANHSVRMYLGMPRKEG